MKLPCESKTDSHTETDTESGTESDTESATESGTESATESDTESDQEEQIEGTQHYKFIVIGIDCGKDHLYPQLKLKFDLLPESELFANKDYPMLRAIIPIHVTLNGLMPHLSAHTIYHLAKWNVLCIQATNRTLEAARKLPKARPFAVHLNTLFNKFFRGSCPICIIFYCNDQEQKYFCLLHPGYLGILYQNDLESMHEQSLTLFLRNKEDWIAYMQQLRSNNKP